ncbi:MAG: hypothetical protein WAS56_02525 [Saprospiraceae bacterium]
MLKNKDILWKGIIEDLFSDFLEFFFHDNMHLFDLERGYEFLDKELEQIFDESDASVRHVDKLVKVYTTIGDEEWILIHVEVQGYQDPKFTDRMYRYYYRIHEKYNRWITALAILSDDDPKFLPSEYQRKFLGTEVTYKFNYYKILTQDKETLIQSKNIFAKVILTVLVALENKGKDEEILFQHKLQITRDLFKNKYPKEKIRNLLKFLNLILFLNKKELQSNFLQEINVLTDKKEVMGIEELIQERLKIEGREEGLEEGLAIGLKKGLEEGIEKGIESGIIKGIEKGKENELLKAISNMTKKGFSDQDIMEILDLSMDKLSMLRKQITL